MEWVYWSFWNKPNLDDKSLSDTDLIKYAKHLGSNPYYVDRSLYRGEIMDSNIMKTRNGTMYDWIDSIRNFTWN